jgi:ankyrin repeat protein
LRCWTLIEKGDIAAILKMIEFGMNVNGLLDENRLTPLMLAIKLQKLNIVETLVSVEVGADLRMTTTSGLNAIHYFAIYGSKDMASSILKRNPDPNIGDRKLFYPIHYACERGNLEIVILLIEKFGSDLLALTEDKQTPLHVAAKHQALPVLNYLITRVQRISNFAFVSLEQGASSAINATDKFGNTCLHYLSLSDGNEDIVHTLLSVKANPIQVNREGENPIDIAKSFNQEKLSSMLTFAAASANKLQSLEISRQMLMLCYNIQDGDTQALIDSITSQNIDVMSPVDEVGDTLLHTAASAGQVEVLNELVRLGAYVFATNSLGCTPLHAAAMQGHCNAVCALMSLKADPRASDSEGYTPLHYAAGEGHLNCLELILDAGHCDETLKTFQGLTPLHVAVTEGQLLIVEYLLQRRPQLASIPDSDGVLPKEYARTSKSQSSDITRLLEVGPLGSICLIILKKSL